MEPEKLSVLELRKARRRATALRWATRAATGYLLIAIAWDTSANVSALEGGKRHLSFGAILGGLIFWAAVGAIAGWFRAKRAER